MVCPIANKASRGSQDGRVSAGENMRPWMKRWIGGAAALSALVLAIRVPSWQAEHKAQMLCDSAVPGRLRAEVLADWHAMDPSAVWLHDLDRHTLGVYRGTLTEKYTCTVTWSEGRVASSEVVFTD